MVLTDVMVGGSGYIIKLKPTIASHFTPVQALRWLNNKHEGLRLQ